MALLLHSFPADSTDAASAIQCRIKSAQRGEGLIEATKRFGSTPGPGLARRGACLVRTNGQRLIRAFRISPFRSIDEQATAQQKAADIICRVFAFISPFTSLL
jgi:hypothetical protein